MAPAWMLHYQPIVDLRTGATVAAEALLRPACGVPDPVWLADMVDGMTATTSTDVVAHALAQTVSWAVEVGVNVPAAGLGSDLVGVVATGGRRGGVCVELTESQPVGADAVAAVWGLADAGVRIALDDFGTGVRTLADLVDLPVDVVKIDRRFVRGLGVDRTNTAVVDHLIRLARALELETVAEGVETRLQHRLLVEMGCDRGQGWLWSPALPAEAFASAHPGPRHGRELPGRTSDRVRGPAGSS
jgi:sensor c-di-GMP phosphodiesterase-like protein